MALQVRRTGGADYGRYIKAAFAGPPGSGKTKLAATAPTPLILDAEGGLMSIADQNVPYVTITQTVELKQLLAVFNQDKENQKSVLGFAPETIVVDTLDEVQKIFVRERLTKEGKETMAQQDWGWLKDRMIDFIRGLRNIEANVIFLFHTKDSHDEDSGVTYVKPGVQGSVSDEIPAYVDVVGLLGIEEFTDVSGDKAIKSVRHVLSLQPSRRCDWLKDRSAKLPKKIVLNGQDDFSKIHATVFAETPTEGAEPVTVEGVPEQKEEPATISEEPKQMPNPLKNEEKKEEVSQ